MFRLQCTTATVILKLVLFDLQEQCGSWIDQDSSCMSFLFCLVILPLWSIGKASALRMGEMGIDPRCPRWYDNSFSFSFRSRWHRSALKGPYALRPVSQQSPQGCPRNNANICLVEHRSFLAFEGGMSTASFLHSSFLHAVSAVMLWLVHAEKVPQASEHLCPAKLQTRCDNSDLQISTLVAIASLA